MLGELWVLLILYFFVQKPLLEFQRAKLKLEEELMLIGDEFTFSIVRPTAFFKSWGGQVELVKGGGPYIMFGDGALSACKPISEADLASFIADCIVEENKIDKVLPIGGPDKALTPLEQGTMLFAVVGKEPKFIKENTTRMPPRAMGKILWRTFSGMLSETAWQDKSLEIKPYLRSCKLPTGRNSPPLPPLQELQCDRSSACNNGSTTFSY